VPVPLLRQRNFSALWWGQLISILGERLTYLALVGLLAHHTGQFQDARSSLLLSLLANVMLAPVLAFAPFTGVWVDRMNLKRVMVVSDALRSGLVILIPVLYTATGNTIPVFVLVFLLFTCNVFFLPAKSAITPEIVAAEQLLAANALLAGAGIAATAAGALIGGWLVDHYGWPFALFVNAGTYLVSVAAILLIRYRPARPHVAPPQISWRQYLGEVSEGWGVVRRSRRVKLALTALAATWVGGGFLHVAGNQHIQRAASAPGMERVGVLLFALGLGSGLGTWWMNTRGRRVSRPIVLGTGLVLTGVGLAVFALSTRFVVFSAAALFIGVAAAPAFTLSETLLQEGTEARQRGRVFSTRDFLMRLVFLLGVTAAGWSARSLGIQSTLILCASIVAAAGMLAFAHSRDPMTQARGEPGGVPVAPEIESLATPAPRAARPPREARRGD
jgi:MFS transporter, DHA3 family, macrolide efflux protein